MARKGKPKVVSHSVRQNVRAQVDEHSAKPSEVRDRIVEMCGHEPRLEMFAREQIPGWYVHGNDVLNGVKIGRTKDAPVLECLKRRLRRKE